MKGSLNCIPHFNLKNTPKKFKFDFDPANLMKSCIISFLTFLQANYKKDPKIIYGDNENNNGCFIICIFTFEILYIYAKIVHNGE